MTEAPANLATIRAVMFNPIVEALDEKGRAADRLLAWQGLSRARLEDPYAIVALVRYVDFFEAAAQHLLEPHLGLRLGLAVRPADLGPLGLLFSAAPTLRSAFSRLSGHIAALQGATNVGLQRYETGSAWTYRIEKQAIWPRVQDAEFSLGAASQLVRSLAGRAWHPLEVHFEHDPPEDCSALRRFFRAPLVFGQPANRLVLADADLDRVIQIEDRRLTQILEHHVRDLLAGNLADADFVKRVERLIALYLGQEKITVERLAEDLGLTPRTLQRKLAAEGTSIRQLLRDQRRNVADLRLRSRHAGHAELAQILGYSDTTAFWRAFKGWRGLSPSAFRKQIGQGRTDDC